MLGGDKKFFYIKEGIPWYGWLGIVGGTYGLFTLIRSSSSNGKVNPALPEPPLPGGG